MQKVLYDNPQFFVREKITKELFFWAYEFVMTRVFGWTLPSSSLIPFADNLNHGPLATTHYFVHKQMEMGQTPKHPNYKIKLGKINLDALKISPLSS